MGVLGKDIFDLSRPRTSTRVRFGEEGYWVEDVPEMQAYGSILTEILNLDLAPFQAAVVAVDQVIEKRDAAAALQAFMDLYGAVGELPLCRLYRKDLRFFGKMQVEYMQRRWTSFKDGENRSTALEQKQRQIGRASCRERV